MKQFFKTNLIMGIAKISPSSDIACQIKYCMKVGSELKKKIMNNRKEKNMMLKGPSPCYEGFMSPAHDVASREGSSSNWSHLFSKVWDCTTVIYTWCYGLYLKCCPKDYMTASDWTFKTELGRSWILKGYGPSGSFLSLFAFQTPSGRWLPWLRVTHYDPTSHSASPQAHQHPNQLAMANHSELNNLLLHRSYLSPVFYHSDRQISTLGNFFLFIFYIFSFINLIIFKNTLQIRNQKAHTEINETRCIHLSEVLYCLNTNLKLWNFSVEFTLSLLNRFLYTSPPSKQSKKKNTWQN